MYEIFFPLQPSGLLLYLDSEDDVPEDDVDRLHVRDSLKLAQEHENRKKKNAQWKVIEKQIEVMLIHWRTRIENKIGLESKQVCGNFLILLNLLIKIIRL